MSVTSSVYDPLGFLAPVMLPANRIGQELCRMNYRWDEEIPATFAQKWDKWLVELKLLSNLSFSRCFMPNNFGKICSARLHHFCDASEIGYSTASYLCLADTSGSVQIVFVMGKARVAPLKVITIPRLELAAAVLAAKVDNVEGRPRANSGFSFLDGQYISP